MDYRTKQRINNLIEYHNTDEQNHPRTLTIELGPDFSEILKRLSIIEGKSKVSVIRDCLIDRMDNWSEAVLLDSPEMLLQT